MSIDLAIQRFFAVVTEQLVLERLVLASLELVVVSALVLAVIHTARLRSSRVIALLWLIALTKPVLSLALGAPAPVLNVGSLDVVAAESSGKEHAVTAVSQIVEPATETGFVVENNAGLIAAGETGRSSAQTVTSLSTRATAGPSLLALGVWLAGVGLLGLLSIADRWRVRQLVRSATLPSPDIEALYTEAGGGLPIERLPRLLITERLESPAIAGTFSPVSFLPAWMTNRPVAERIVWSLRHEITHWRHRDHVAGFVYEVARALFFFHPLVWWIGRRWKAASEVACDRALVATRHDARRYAEQLYQILARVHTRRCIMLTSGLFATRTQIGKRIELLLKARPRGRAGRKLPAVLFLLVFTALTFSLGVELSTQADPADVYIKKSSDEPGDVVTTIRFAEDDESVLSVTLRGDVEFNDDKTDIVSISSDGKFVVSEVRDGVEHKLEVTPGDGEELEWEYRVADKVRPFDDAAREWFVKCLEALEMKGEHNSIFISKGDGSRVIAVKPHVKILLESDGDTWNLTQSSEGDSETSSTIETVILDEDGKTVDIYVSTDDRMLISEGSHTSIGFSKDGRLFIRVKKDADRHELEIVTGDESRKYVYKLNGEERPYDDEAKKIFSKYVREVDEGFEIKFRDKD
jgi:beta-lactamase regulating signal transducer with metallopeptidase domain